MNLYTQYCSRKLFFFSHFGAAKHNADILSGTGLSYSLWHHPWNCWNFNWPFEELYFSALLCLASFFSPVVAWNLLRNSLAAEGSTVSQPLSGPFDAEAVKQNFKASQWQIVTALSIKPKQWPSDKIQGRIVGKFLQNFLYSVLHLFSYQEVFSVSYNNNSKTNKTRTIVFRENLLNKWLISATNILLLNLFYLLLNTEYVWICRT